MPSRDFDQGRVKKFKLVSTRNEGMFMCPVMSLVVGLSQITTKIIRGLSWRADTPGHGFGCVKWQNVEF